jgi:hypothetical protein
MASEHQRAVELTKLGLESARKLGLSPADTAAVLGVPVGALGALKKGERLVDGYNGEAERADALGRIVSRLTALLGPEETKWRSWLRRLSPQLGDTPLHAITQRDGVQGVADFLGQSDLNIHGHEP